ncbi:MAG: hypothetical protein ACOX9E_03235 [Lentisphaeria bacterium]|jgi:hypothetical protein
MMLAFLCCVLAVSAVASAQFVVNGDFNQVEPCGVRATDDQGYGVWEVSGTPTLKPKGWVLNPTLTGKLEMVPSAGDGYHLKLTSNDLKRAGHLYQPAPWFKNYQWYKVSAKVKGTKGAIGFYRYPPAGGVVVKQDFVLSSPSAEWRDVFFWFMAEPSEAQRVCLFACVAGSEGDTFELDDLQVEMVETPAFAKSEPIVIENRHCRLVLSAKGELLEAVAKLPEEKPIPGSGCAFFRMKAGERGWLPLVGLERGVGNRLTCVFAEPGYSMDVLFRCYDAYFTFMVTDVRGADVSEISFLKMNLRLSENYGGLLNTASGDGVSAVLLSCNDKTHAASSMSKELGLTATAYSEFGMPGAKVALAVVPSESLLDTIEVVEIEQDLFHPVRDGLWLRRHPGRFASYMMAFGVTEANVDEVIEFARGGFGCIEISDGWWDSTPTYAPNRNLYPDGMESLKRVCQKIHDAGLQVGLHAMQGMVGWGGRLGMRDPYVSPKADSRLLQSHRSVLEQDMAADATELVVAGDLSQWPEKGDLNLAGEVVRYSGKDGKRLTGCERGLHGTLQKAHPKGAAVGVLVNCFPIWGYTKYTPDIESTMFEEIVDNLAYVFNETGADMAYFDAGEEWSKNPPHWRNVGKFALAFQKRLKKPIFLGGNNLYTNLSWHAITRGAPNYDPITHGRDEFSLRYKGTNPIRNAKNFLVGDTGWFAAHAHSPSVCAVTPDELMLICLKAVAGNSPFSFHAPYGSYYTNKRKPEMLAIIKLTDQLKREGSIPEAIRSTMWSPDVRHTLDLVEGSGGKRWQLRPNHKTQHAVLRESEMGRSEIQLSNPFGKQGPLVRLKAMSFVEEKGDADSLVLADFAEGTEFSELSTANGMLKMELVRGEGTAPDGSAILEIRSKNEGKGTSSWLCAAKQLSPAMNLLGHRHLGLWVHSDGRRGIMNVQLGSTESAGSVREHYIDLSFTGWRRFVLDRPETEHFYHYSWPYGMTAPMYRRYPYHQVTAVKLYLNGLPAQSEGVVKIGRLEALAERPYPVENPRLAVGESSCLVPVRMRPDDYVEISPEGRYVLYEANGGVLATGRTEGVLELPRGDYRVAFSSRRAAGLSNRVDLTVFTQGDIVHEFELQSAFELPADELRCRRGDRGALRVMSGLSQLVPFASPRELDALGGTQSSWSIQTPWLDGEERGAAVFIRSLAGQPRFDIAAKPQFELSVEKFQSLDGFAESAANTYEKCVSGRGKAITDQGVVSPGVSQSVSLSPADYREYGSAMRYAAKATGDGNWSAKGCTFAKPLDLSQANVISLWLHGDNQGEDLRIQFWDVNGKYADWVVPVNVSGWKRLVLPMSQASSGFDWSKVGHFVLLFNKLPLNRECVVHLADLRALNLPKAAEQDLTGLELTLNGAKLALPEKLARGEALLVDENGNGTVWTDGTEAIRSFKLPDAANVLKLKAGENKVSLAAKTGSAMTVQVLAVPDKK